MLAPTYHLHPQHLLHRQLLCVLLQEQRQPQQQSALNSFLLHFLGSTRSLCFSSFFGFNAGKAFQILFRNLTNKVLVRCFDHLQIFVRGAITYVGVCNTLVAINTGLACLHCIQVLLTCAWLLEFRHHGFKIMTVTAFTRVRRLHPRPFVFREVQTFSSNFSGVLIVPTNLPQTSLEALTLRMILCVQSLGT